MKTKWRICLAAVCLMIFFCMAVIFFCVSAQAEEEDSASTSEEPVSTATASVEATATPEATAETAEVEEDTDPEEDADSETASEESDTEATATPEPAATEEEEDEEVYIVSFTALDQTEWTLEEKPTLEEAQALFPDALEVQLSDGQTIQVSISWSCDAYTSDAEAYVFQSSLESSDYSLSSDLTLPSVTLYIVSATEIVSGDFTFTINEDDTLTLIAYTGSSASVTVPETVEDMQVVGVSASAFSGNTTLETLILPTGLLTLEEGAFQNCTALKTVEIPDSLLEVGEDLFDGCDALETLQINISEEITVTDGFGYSREITDEDGNVSEISVSIDIAFTDYCVLSGGIWHQEGSIQIDADHTAEINAGGQLLIGSSGTITVFGTLQCSGSCTNEGQVIACAGSVSGVDGDVVQSHTWSNGVCTVCGKTTQVLTVTALQDSYEKTYDGEAGIALSADDFELGNIQDGDEVYIAAINLDFNESDVGSYVAAISFELGGSDADNYSTAAMEISIVITQKQVTVTPVSGQSKVYGASDPTIRATYQGVVSGETLSGALSREKGEDVGTYKILIGTLQTLNPNYEIVLEEVTFSITAKSISASSVKLAKVSNQCYTGSAVEPDVVLSDGTTVLTEGTDYTVSYSNNIEVGTAKVTVTGIGNYKGSRSATFQIIEVTSSSSSSSSSTSFDDSDEDSAEITDHLVLDETDWGEILFDQDDSALTFAWYSRQVEDDEEVHVVLCIAAQELEDALGDVISGEYGEPRLRLSMELISALRSAGYTDVELQVGEAELRVPLSTMYAQYVSESGTLVASCYEMRVWPVAEEELTEIVLEQLSGYELTAAPAHCEVLVFSEDEEDEGTDVLSLMLGVQLRIVPEEEPDYANVHYDVLRANDADPEAVYALEGAAFILDAEEVKCTLTPKFGGLYCLITEIVE